MGRWFSEGRVLSAAMIAGLSRWKELAAYRRFRFVLQNDLDAVQDVRLLRQGETTSLRQRA